MPDLDHVLGSILLGEVVLFTLDVLAVDYHARKRRPSQRRKEKESITC